jgi:hypothetical protein
MGSVDLPDQPDEPVRVMRANAGGADRNAHASRELPDPDERGRAYEAMRAHVSAETPTEASPGQPPDPGDRQSDRDEAPRFHEMRADHERHRPETPQAAADRPGDRPEQPAATARTLDRSREGERALSPHAEVIEDNKQGGRLDDSKQQLKSEDRLDENVVNAQTPDEAPHGQPPDTTDHRSYWDEVPRFYEMWADHEGRLLERRSEAEPDRSSNPPELPAATVEAVGRIREAERTLSPDAQVIEQENKYGGWLEGFEFRLKGEDRLNEKIAPVLEVEPQITAAEALREVPDAIRYTYCFDAERYTKGYYDIKERFENRGHEIYYSENYWTNREYKGINTRWVTAEGQRFEVQFHTPESFHAKHCVTHLAYERIRDLATSDEERAKLKEFQREVSSWVRVPDGAADIPNYRKEGF